MSRHVIAAAAMALAAQPALAEQELSPSGSYIAQLDGPAARCAVPSRFRFVVGDAITDGKITFQGRNYVPRGRLQPETRMADIRLILRHDDPQPLVSLRTKADGTWNGAWTGRKPGCTGMVRILPR